MPRTSVRHVAAAKAQVKSADILRELRLHQLELEAQNRQLCEAQALLEESRASYVELYDFAPVGYATLDRRSVVQQINLTGAAGAAPVIHVIMTDISERKEMDAQRSSLLARERKARELAETASRVRDEFFAVVSHELRTPLAPMALWVELLRQQIARFQP